MMKHEVERNNLNFWGWGMIAGMVFMSLSIGPSLKFLGLKGLMIPLLFFILLLVSAFQAERLKKKNNIHTYAEVLAYMENRAVDQEKQKKEKDSFRKRKVLMMFVSACITLLFVGLGFIVFLF